MSESTGSVAPEGRSREEGGPFPRGSSAVSSQSIMGLVFCEVTPGSYVFVEGQTAFVSLPAPS